MASPAMNYALLSSRWALSGASLDLDFCKSRAFGATSIESALSLTRATSGYADDDNGGWQSFGNGVLRRTSMGLKIEEPRTNLFAAPLFPATQTITVANGTVYTVALYAAGGTLTLSGAGSGTVNANSSVTFTSSTTDLTVTCNNITGAFQCVNVEAGLFKTTPISAPRNADAILANNSNSFLSLSQGAFFLEWVDLAGPTTVDRYLASFRVDNNNIIAIRARQPDGKIDFFVVNGGVAQCDLVSTNAAAIGNRYRAAASWETNRFSLRLSSSLGSPANDTSGTPPSGIGVLGIGQYGTNSGYLNSTLRRFAAFSNSLSDEQMFSLVA